MHIRLWYIIEIFVIIIQLKFSKSRNIAIFSWNTKKLSFKILKAKKKFLENHFTIIISKMVPCTFIHIRPPFHIAFLPACIL